MKYETQIQRPQIGVTPCPERRQYELVEVARRRGFTNIEVVDDDLGRIAQVKGVPRPTVEDCVEPS
jgi:hypothetical protein